MFTQEKAIALLRRGALWVDERLFISKLFESTAGHKVPKSSGSWFYVFGSATLVCFMIQVVTGTMLALVYVPSAAEAYDTLEYMTYEQYLGWFIRAVHNYGSLFMVIIMMLHMTQVYLWGAYKYPRELTWVTGVLLMACTLGMAFSGQVLRFDQDAYWGLGIGVAIMGRIPIIGENLIHLMLGGPDIGGETLTRFFSLHVFILPGSIIAIVSLHLRLVLAKGINEYPKPGHQVDPKTYDAEYATIIKKEGVAFVPQAINKDLVAAAVVIFGIFACAFFFGPKGPEGVPNPTYIDTIPRPDMPFLWIFAVASLIPPYLEAPVLIGMPAVVGAILIALPFFNNQGEKHWSRRPIAVCVVILSWVSLVALTYLGATAPWSPVMAAWSSDLTPDSALKNRTPLELQGALVLQQQQCRNCHAIDGIGGHRGPDLAAVGTRLTEPQLVRQVIQGGGNMPAYGKNLTPAQVDALVSYLVSLRPPGEEPSRDPTFPAQPPRELTRDPAQSPPIAAGS